MIMIFLFKLTETSIEKTFSVPNILASLKLQRDVFPELSPDKLSLIMLKFFLPLFFNYLRKFNKAYLVKGLFQISDQKSRPVIKK